MATIYVLSVNQPAHPNKWVVDTVEREEDGTISITKTETFDVRGQDMAAYGHMAHLFIPRGEGDPEGMVGRWVP